MDADEFLPVTLIDEDENFIIKLNQYWPHGLKTSEVEDNAIYCTYSATKSLPLIRFALAI